MKMLSALEREIATTLVEALVEYGLNSHLEPYGVRGAENWFFDNDMNRFGFGASGGASKICIWHDDLANWVIKVGYTYGVKMDYAAKEYENYCLAEEAGLASYFPQTIYLGEFGGRPFYLQEWAECDTNQVSSEWYERLRDQYDEEGEEYDCDCLWDEIQCMDDDQKAFLTFRDNELCHFLWDNHIGDLHEGNFGYIGSRMVIVDFSGWHQ